MSKAKPDSSQDGRAPSAEELASLLGTSHGAFEALAHAGAGVTREWKRYSKKAPWALKVSAGERTLFSLTPQVNQFEVTVVLWAVGGRNSTTGLRSKSHGPAVG